MNMNKSGKKLTKTEKRELNCSNVKLGNEKKKWGSYRQPNKPHSLAARFSIETRAKYMFGQSPSPTNQ
jgi:hypothetical protein